MQVPSSPDQAVSGTVVHQPSHASHLPNLPGETLNACLTAVFFMCKHLGAPLICIVDWTAAHQLRCLFVCSQASCGACGCMSHNMHKEAPVCLSAAASKPFTSASLLRCCRSPSTLMTAARSVCISEGPRFGPRGARPHSAAAAAAALSLTPKPSMQRTVMCEP